jgi:hypothetical protein
MLPLVTEVPALGRPPLILLASDSEDGKESPNLFGGTKDGEGNDSKNDFGAAIDGNCESELKELNIFFLKKKFIFFF